MISSLLVHNKHDSVLTISLFFVGIPLLRKDLQDETLPLLRQFTTRMYEVAGVSIDGNKVVIANKHALEIAAVTITDDDDDGPYPISIDISGYGRIEPSDDFGSFHGRMAMSCSRYSITANEDSGIVWIFNINDCAYHKMLDRRDGNLRKFENENCGEEEDGNYPGRKIAVGKVEFPLWGGNKPARKRQKQQQVGFSSLDCSDEDDSFGLAACRDEDDSFGEGGPMAVAIRGRWVVAGFSNGTLSKALLPEQFAEPESSAVGVSSNYLASCSHLPSDEWHHPQLACAENSDDEESSIAASSNSEDDELDVSDEDRHY